ncbi:unnamed protein product [Caenorhabditis nigoni]
MVNVAEEPTERIFGAHNKGFVGLAHNESGYDWQHPELAHLEDQSHVVTAGTKIICICTTKEFDFPTFSNI